VTTSNLTDSFISLVGPIYHRMQWVSGAFFPRGKTAAAWSWPLTSI